MLNVIRTSDQALVQQALGGRREAFDALVRRHLGSVHGVAYAALRNHADAEDVTQEAFLKAFDQLPNLREPKRFGGWVATIARNLCRQHWRAASRNMPEATATEADAREDVLRHEREQVVQAALQHLDQTSREILILYYFAGRNTREIAATLDITTAAAKKRLERARAGLGMQLLEQFKKTNPDEDGALLKRVLLALAATTPAWSANAARAGVAVGSLASIAGAAASGLAIVGLATAAIIYKSVGSDLAGSRNNVVNATAGIAPQAEAVALDRQPPRSATSPNRASVAASQPTRTDTKASSPARHLDIDMESLRNQMTNALDAPISLAFEFEHINEIIAFVAKSLDINVVVLSETTAEPPRDVGPYGPYTTDGQLQHVELRDVALHEALSAIVLPLGLNYAVEPGYIWISTPDRIRSEVVEASREEYAAYPEQALLENQPPVSLVFENQHAQTVLDFLADSLDLNILIDYRAVAPPSPIRVREKVDEAPAETGSLFPAVERFVESPDGLRVSLSFNGGRARLYQAGDAMGPFELVSIEPEANRILLRDSETGTKHFVHATQNNAEQRPKEIHEEPIPEPVGPGIVPYVSVDGVALKDALRGLLRMVDYDYRVMPGYLAIGPRDTVKVYDQVRTIDSKEAPDKLAASLEEEHAIAIKSDMRLTGLIDLLESALDGKAPDAFGIETASSDVRMRQTPRVEFPNAIPLAVTLDAVLTPMGLTWAAEEDGLVIQKADGE